jgi:hypothetical protein
LELHVRASERALARVRGCVRAGPHKRKSERASARACARACARSSVRAGVRAWPRACAHAANLSRDRVSGPHPCPNPETRSCPPASTVAPTPRDSDGAGRRPLEHGAVVALRAISRGSLRRRCMGQTKPWGPRRCGKSWKGLVKSRRMPFRRLQRGRLRVPEAPASLRTQPAAARAHTLDCRIFCMSGCGCDHDAT